MCCSGDHQPRTPSARVRRCLRMPAFPIVRWSYLSLSEHDLSPRAGQQPHAAAAQREEYRFRHELPDLPRRLGHHVELQLQRAAVLSTVGCGTITSVVEEQHPITRQQLRRMLEKESVTGVGKLQGGAIDVGVLQSLPPPLVVVNPPPTHTHTPTDRRTTSPHRKVAIASQDPHDRCHVHREKDQPMHMR